MAHDQVGSFSLWYRFRAIVLYSLLHLGGPAQLDDSADPRRQLNREYLQRKETHLAAKQGRPAQAIPEGATAAGGQADPFVLCVILGVAAVVTLVAFMVAAA